MTPLSAQLLFSAPSNIQQQYQPLINVAFAPNETGQSVVGGGRAGWTPVPASRSGSAAPLNSVYTAINPSSSVPVSSSQYGSSAKYTAPVAASLSMAQPVSSSQPNSTYVFSESIARSSYQKPQSTYMIQPAKYRQAFPSTQNSTRRSGKSAGGTRKSSKGSKLINSEVMPIPMIKPHRHGATLGFNLPDQGLTLYLDINELATKPMAQNIGLKVVSHANKDGEEEEDKDSSTENSIESLNEVKPPKDASGKPLRKRVAKVVKRIKDISKNVTIATASKSTVKSLKQLNATKTTERPLQTTGNSLSGTTKKIKYGTKTKTSSGGNKLNILSPAQANKAKQVIEIPSLNHEVNINPNKIFDDVDLGKALTSTTTGSSTGNATRNDIPPTASRIPATYVSQVEYKGDAEEDLEPKNVVAQKKEADSAVEENSSSENNGETTSELMKETVSSGEALNEAIQGGGAEDEIEREKRPASTEEREESDAVGDNDTDSNEAENVVPAGNSKEEAEEEEVEEEDVTAAIVTTTVTPSGEELDSTATTTVAPGPASVTQTILPVEDALRIATTTIPLRANEVEPPVTESAVNSTTAKKQEVVDNRFVQQMQSLIEKSAKLLDQSSQTCSAAVDKCNKRNSCEPNLKSVTTETATTVREIAQQLEANLILNEVANTFENELQDSMDFSTSGYTIILPSNSAVRRLPPSLLRKWKQTGDGLSLDVYLLEGAHSLESLAGKKMVETRAKVKLHIGNPHNETYTINGQRVVHANQRAPSGGIVHVIDGLLYPHADKDIIETLKSCGRLDGFVTLAEGTGFAHTLKRGKAHKHRSETMNRSSIDSSH